MRKREGSGDQLGLNTSRPAAVCQRYYAKSGLARFVYRRMADMLSKGIEKGEPDLTFIYKYAVPGHRPNGGRYVYDRGGRGHPHHLRGSCSPN